MRTQTCFLVVAAVAVLVCLGGVASAQPGVAYSDDIVQPVRVDIPREGLTLGASIGRGSISIDCDICDSVDTLTEALSLSMHAGFMVTPQLAVIGEYWTIRYNDRGSEWFNDSLDHLIAQDIATVGGQLWLTPRFYVRAGLGVGRHTSDSLYAKPELYRDRQAPASANSQQQMKSADGFSPAAIFGIGFEFAHTSKFAADVQLRVGSTRRNSDEFQVHNTGLNFGVAWY